MKVKIFLTHIMERTMCKAIDYLNRVIDDYDISITWLVRQINKKFGTNYTKQALNYTLTSGKDISTTLYREIRTILDEHNFNVSPFDNEKLNKQAAELTNHTSILAIKTIDALEDGLVTEKEIADLRIELADCEQRMNRIKELLKKMNKK